MGKQAPTLQCFQYEDVDTAKFPQSPPHFFPFLLSYPYVIISHKVNTASVHQVLVCIHCSCLSTLHTDMSLWLSHTRAGRSPGSHNPGAIPQHLIPLSCEPHPISFHPDAEWHFNPPAYCSAFFSHYSSLEHVLSGFRLLTNSISATLRVWLRFAASGKNTYFDEYLKGILQTL